MKRKGKQHQISEEKIKNIWKQKEKVRQQPDPMDNGKCISSRAEDRHKSSWTIE